jgi:predicted DsbA family dithiol-disulfide isomerase
MARRLDTPTVLEKCVLVPRPGEAEARKAGVTEFPTFVHQDGRRFSGTKTAAEFIKWAEGE